MNIDIDDIEEYFNNFPDQDYWWSQLKIYTFNFNGTFYPFGDVEKLEKYAKTHSRCIILREYDRLSIIGHETNLYDPYFYKKYGRDKDDLDYGIYIIRSIENL